MVKDYSNKSLRLCLRLMCFTSNIGKRKITYTICSRDHKNYPYFMAVSCFINDRIPSSIKLEIVGIHIFFYHFITFNLWFFFFMKYIFYYHFIVVKGPIISWWINSGRNKRNPFWRWRKKKWEIGSHLDNMIKYSSGSTTKCGIDGILQLGILLWSTPGK